MVVDCHPVVYVIDVNHKQIEFHIFFSNWEKKSPKLHC